MTHDVARAEVDGMLETFFAERIARASSFAPGYESLWRRMREAVRGGKRVRPRLLITTHHQLGGMNDEDALAAATAVELLHTALLFHDDILDGDLIRRGRPNLQGSFVADALTKPVSAASSSLWGMTAGLLGGDLLISAAHAFLSRIRSDSRVDVQEIFDDCMMTTAAGEMLDVGFGATIVEPDARTIMRMMTDKTAAYSFAAPLRMGAALAGADVEVASALAQIGSDLGFIYQLRDDVLGVFGQQSLVGKPTDSDLREGKRTLLIAHAETSPHWREVSHLFGHRTMSDEDVAALRRAIADSGALEEVARVLTHRGDQVRAAIGAMDVPAALQEELTALARYCEERRS